MSEIFTHKYNFTYPYELRPLELELQCYRFNWGPEKGGLGQAGHFRNIADMLWGSKSECPFIWNPWAEKMNDVVHVHPITKEPCRHVAFSGCANSGKSHFAGLYAIINWLCDPLNTYVFVTSTSITDSKHRVWKSINRLFTSVPKLPGVLVDSQAKIATAKEYGKHDDTAGIFIVAGSPSKAREGVGKLIGKKNMRVFLIADELPELSPAILDAAFGNLAMNNFFQFIAMGNFKSRYDPFGEFIEPKDGWESIDVDSEEWECKLHGAYCVRFDGMKSPNILAGKELYPHIYGPKQLKEHRQSFSEHSAQFWRMCRSFEALIGEDDIIYSESDFITGKAYESAIWMGNYTKVAGIDPAFTNGGDRFVLYFGKYGLSNEGVWTLLLDNYVLLREDVRILSQRNRSFQMADQIKAKCEEYGVLPENCGMDCTATGRPLADVIDEVWKGSIYRVDFSGAPTERIATADGKLACDAYDRRVTEIWYSGKEFMKGKQFRGLCPEAAREAKARKYETIKGAMGLKVKAETKSDMKERLMFSPDIIEAAFVMLDLCRERFDFVPVNVENQVATTGWRDAWKRRAGELNQLYSVDNGMQLR